MENRSIILECALRLFAARGYDAVGVQEIAEAAGITKPTLYHYFGSKRGLLDALLEQQFAPLNGAVEAAVAYHGDLPLSLEHLARAYFRFVGEHRAFYRIQLAMYFAPPESEANRAVDRFNQVHYHFVEALFQNAARDHGNMKGRQRAYAATFIGVLNTYIGLSLNGYTELDDVLLHQAVHQFMHGIFS